MNFQPGRFLPFVLFASESANIKLPTGSMLVPRSVSYFLICVLPIEFRRRFGLYGGNSGGSISLMHPHNGSTMGGGHEGRMKLHHPPNSFVVQVNIA